MEQSPSWEANRFLAIQGIPHTQQNLKVYYCIHNFPAPALILNQINPVHNSPFHFLKISFLLLSSHVGLGHPHGLFSLSFPHQNPVYNSPVPHKCHMPRPSLSSWI